MAITMQGSWLVRVKLKNAGFAQRFRISGASSGNGTYPGLSTSAPVQVHGDSWTITIEHDPGTGFRASEDRIKFPVIQGGSYVFDIESNDTGLDRDFDDLVLTCSTPQTILDFVIYGHVSHYGDNCIFNPCTYRPWVTIDSPLALAEAVENVDLRALVEKAYPSRIPPYPPPPPQLRAPTPFIPLVLNLESELALPPKRAMLLPAVAPALASEAKLEAKKLDVKARASEPLASLAMRSVTLEPEAAMAPVRLENRVALAGVRERYRVFCRSTPMAHTAIRFMEYDRTPTELAGGPYTGRGDRVSFGACATDGNGNYIFRFQRSLGELLTEAFRDIAPGEDVNVAFMPDMIAQVLDPAAPGGVAHETAPFWNIPLFRRIDICVPESRVSPAPAACNGTRAIQGIGNISFIDPLNTLDAQGRITARAVTRNTPATSCAAWAGSLDLIACFVGRPVQYYTIRYRPLGAPESAWQYFLEEERRLVLEHLGLPGYQGDVIGPRSVPGLVPVGAPTGTAVAYLNIESDPTLNNDPSNTWLPQNPYLKATLTSSRYAPTPGPVELELKGFDTAGNFVTGAEDTVILYINNDLPEYRIDRVAMGGPPGGDCALFTVTNAAPATPMAIKFKANEAHGFLQSYRLSVTRGNSGTVIPLQPTGALIDVASSSCQFRGTDDDPAAHDPSGSVEALVQPTTPLPGSWLEGRQFCTFVISLSVTMRVTNGYNTGTSTPSPRTFFFGMQQVP